MKLQTENKNNSNPQWIGELVKTQNAYCCEIWSSDYCGKFWKPQRMQWVAELVEKTKSQYMMKFVKFTDKVSKESLQKIKAFSIGGNFVNPQSLLIQGEIVRTQSTQYRGDSLKTINSLYKCESLQEFEVLSIWENS